MHQIVKPSLKDIPAVLDLIKLVVEDTFQKELILNEEDLAIEIEFLYTSFENSFNDKTNFYLLAKVDSKIVGLISYGDINRIIKKNTEFDTTKTVEIKSAYIHPNFQNKGVGTHLFNEIIKLIKSTNFSYYCLDSGYQSAQVFWKNKLGEAQFVIKDYWGKSLDHHIWLIDL